MAENPPSSESRNESIPRDRSIPGGGRKAEVPSTLPILPLRGMVVFPGVVVPLTVKRPSSVKLLDETLPQSKWVGLVAQRNEKEDPEPGDLHQVGVAAQV